MRRAQRSIRYERPRSAAATGSTAWTSPWSALQAAQAEESLAETVEKMGRDLAAIDQRVSNVMDKIVDAQTDVDRATANAELAKLRREKSQLEARIAEAKRRARR